MIDGIEIGSPDLGEISCVVEFIGELCGFEFLERKSIIEIFSCDEIIGIFIGLC